MIKIISSFSFFIIQTCVFSYITRYIMFDVAHNICKLVLNKSVLYDKTVDSGFDWLFLIVFITYFISAACIIFMCVCVRYRPMFAYVQSFTCLVLIQVLLFTCWVVWPQYHDGALLGNHDGFRIIYMPIIIPFFNMLVMLFIAIIDYAKKQFLCFQRPK